MAFCTDGERLFGQAAIDRYSAIIACRLQKLRLDERWRKREPFKAKGRGAAPGKFNLLAQKSHGEVLHFLKYQVYYVLDDNGISDPFPGLKVQVTYTELLPSFFIRLRIQHVKSLNASANNPPKHSGNSL
jgi:hypothetical protein